MWHARKTGDMICRIAAEVVSMSVGLDPPHQKRVRKRFPEATTVQLSEGYRTGCLDLILGKGGRPICCSTAEGRAVIQARIARLANWKRAHGDPGRQERAGPRPIPERGARVWLADQGGFGTD